MTIQVISNGEDGSVVREKLNDNFAELDLAVTPGVLGPPPAVNGTETWIVSQGGTGYDLTAQQVAGNPYTAKKSLALDRIGGFTVFDNIHPINTVTNDTLIGNEPFVGYINGADAVINNGAGTYFVPCLQLDTGTTNAGYATALHTNFPHLFVPGVSDLDARFLVLLPTLPVALSQDYTIQVGFITGVPALATRGMYFELTGASPNWQKVVKNAGGTTTVDTGIAATTSAVTLRIKYDPVATETKFWIDGVSSPAIDDSTRVVDFLSLLGMAVQIRKTFGAIGRSVIYLAHRYDNARAAVPHFS